MRLISFFLVFFVFTADVAATETPWIDHGGMLRTRLVVASNEMASNDGVLLAWEAKLEKGWKTYWRSPGEAGLPVRVFAEGEEIAPLYPYPERFELFGIETFGYSNQLLLPFRMKSSLEGPVTVKVDFMVCKDICVPFEQSYTLHSSEIAGAGSLHDIRFEAWLAKVPSVEPKNTNGMQILAAKVAGRLGNQKLIIDVSADVDLSNADMLAEVNDMFHFSSPKTRLLEDGKKARLVLGAMTGSKPVDLRGKTVRLTFSDGHGGVIDRMINLAK